MWINDRPAQETAGTYNEPPRSLPEHVSFGCDREGDYHHLDWDAHIVIRFDDADRIERRTHLGDRNFNDDLLIIAEEIGWRIRKRIGIFEFFAEAR